jgi:hypothetical protein
MKPADDQNVEQSTVDYRAAVGGGVGGGLVAVGLLSVGVISWRRGWFKKDKEAKKTPSPCMYRTQRAELA